MNQLGVALVLAVALGTMVGCDVGGPKRASDIQNLNGISDDISATTMTESDLKRPHDPNMQTTIPRTYQTNDIQ
ncbi:MAG: hypothetical protein JO038_01750 [Alphaproteobacteria bacterium]|nr:hypothetical protein [Alphaproteobacteria bacterium]